jgi:recombinational DNA repair protein RecT
MKLALQAGEVLKIESRLVYSKDLFEVEEGIESRIIHKHGLSDRGEKIGAYCVWKLKNGETQFEIMSKEEILAIRDRSSSKTKDGTIVGPWKTDEAEMWRKTVVRRASKYMPLSTEAQRAVMADNQAEGIIDADDYSGNEMDITDFNDVPAAEAQVQTLEEKIVAKAKPAPKTPLHIDILEAGDDDEGMTDWDGWAISACEIVASLSEEEREAWRVLHEGMLDEAELMAPRNTTKLMKFFK